MLTLRVRVSMWPAMGSDDRLTRRTFFERAGIGALGVALTGRPDISFTQTPVPNSSGTAPPQLRTPARACDCHMHIYDPARFPMPPMERAAPANAAVAQYRLLQKRLGTARVIVVTPRNYATDNRVTIDAIAQMAPNARGVAVVHPRVTDAELKQLHAGGIRGIRFSLTDPKPRS